MSRPAFGCQPALKGNTFLLVDPSFIACFCAALPLFSLFCSDSDGKSCFSIKKLISTSERRAEHRLLVEIHNKGHKFRGDFSGIILVAWNMRQKIELWKTLQVGVGEWKIYRQSPIFFHFAAVQRIEEKW